MGGLGLGLLAACGSVLTELIVSRAAAAAIVAAIVALYAITELGGFSLWRPNSSWQVPASYRRTPYVRVVAFVWGAALGMGWLTRNATSAFLMFFLACFALPAACALVAGLAFGLGRGLTLVALVGPKTYAAVVDRLTRLRRHRRLPRLGTAALGVMLVLTLIT